MVLKLSSVNTGDSYNQYGKYRILVNWSITKTQTYFQIARIVLAIALVAPALSNPYYYSYSTFPAVQTYGGLRARAYNAPSNTLTHPSFSTATGDLSALSAIWAKAKPLVEQTKAIGKDIFPSSGPIVQGNVIRTKYGDAPLPAGNVLPPQVRQQIGAIADAMQRVVASDTIDPQALNYLLEVTRDMDFS